MLILTLKLDPAAFATLDALRQQHFPPERNFLAAHITLFYALPDDQEASIRAELKTRCAITPVIPLTLPAVRFLGRGVAVAVESPALLELRRQLALAWQPWLGAQDRQRSQPHVTIQNKVTPEVARLLYEQLHQTWHPLAAQGEGLLLWRYLGGPWEGLKEFTFGRI
ncbi:MAG: 2'-5' RNA ligase family protein [Caldilineaceae bacterium]